MVTGALAALAAGVLGIALGATGGRDGPAERDVAARGTGFALHYPPTWRRTASAPRIPGLPSLGPGSVYLTTDGGRAGFFAARHRGDVSGTIPAALAARLGSADVERSVARLSASADAYRWASRRAGSSRVELFAVPSSGTTILAGCAAAPDARPGALPECRRILAGLRPGDRPTGELQPDPAFAAALSRSLRTARSAERLGAHELHAARTAEGQARAALATGRRVRAAGSALAAMSPNEPARGWHEQAATALGHIGGAFVTLARGFRSRDREIIGVAQRAMRRSERELSVALAALSSIGFAVAR